MVPGQGAIRLARVALFSAAAVGLGCAAHLLVSGETVPLGGAAIAFGLVLLLINPIAGRRCGRRLLFGLMAGIQAALHLTFSITSRGLDCPAVSGLQPHHHAPGSRPRSAAGCGPALFQPVEIGAGHGGRTAMLVAHLLATLIVVLILAHGEQAVWALAAALRFALVIWPAPVGPAVVPSAGGVLPRFVRPRTAVHRRTIRRRGPPVVIRGRLALR